MFNFVGKSKKILPLCQIFLHFFSILIFFFVLLHIYECYMQKSLISVTSDAHFVLFPQIIWKFHEK